MSTRARRANAAWIAGDSEWLTGWPNNAYCFGIRSILRQGRPTMGRALRVPHPACRVEREVGENAVGAGALERGQRFQRAGALVEPAVGVRGLEHRVLAADLVSEGRHAEQLLHPAQHVEVG